LDTFGPTRWLTRFCAGHWYLHRFLDPLYRHAEAKGYKSLVRENALRLLERAHIERLTEGGNPDDAAVLAMDRFEHLAAKGDPDAAYRLAEAHRTGFGRPRNHWKAIEHYQMAVALGHPEAAARLRKVEGREEVEDDSHEAFGRRALLKATYAQGRGQRHAKALGARVDEMRREGVGFRGAAILLAMAGLLISYLALDIYFSGMGAWRPDPSRVVWGLFGKIHPPRGEDTGRVLPGWMRPDASSVAFTVDNHVRDASGSYRVGDFKGRVVYLQVVDGGHPAVFESVAYLRGLAYRKDPDMVFFLLYVPSRERVADANFAIQWALDFAPGLVESRKAIRPLGEIRTYPMNFVIDRRGRIRQRWAGFSEALTEDALKAAMAES